ncbi:heme-binding protein [Pseudonocardia ailaonensis]|uniref:Heme-binding protein n=1 Tax=Pseudonocardia ailaonensis TaxID=367279 RepID=A0ABN2N1V2_9PSEU
MTAMTLAIARMVTDAALWCAEQSGVKVAVVVVDGHGDPQMVAVQEGAPLIARDFALKKAYTALVFHSPPDELSGADGFSAVRQAAVADPRLLFMAGGWPLDIGGRTVGAIGVSGGSLSEDRECARAGAEAVRRHAAVQP